MTMSTNIDDRELVKFRDAALHPLSKVAVIVEQGDPIPVYTEIGTNLFLSNELPTIPSTDVILISVLYTGIGERRLRSFGVSCHMEGVASLHMDGSFVYSIRTNAGQSNAEFIFNPYLKVIGLLEVKFKARDNSALSTVSAFIQGYDIQI
jgi:hypothetical protein